MIGGKMISRWAMLGGLVLVLGAGPALAATFGEDVDFLKKHVKVVTLTDAKTGAAVAVAPAYQGRVMTSSTSGADGTSFGWINRELIASGKKLAHINPYGGEDRFWLGPEGSKYALFFTKGAAMDFEHWQTPAFLDTEPFDVIKQTSDTVVFGRTVRFSNYAGTEFDAGIRRTVRLVKTDQALRRWGINKAMPNLKMVGYETVNQLTNTGKAPWRKETGLPSIWILGMFNPSPSAVVIAPYRQGSETELGPVINDIYFGKIPAERLKVGKGVVFFRGDGQQRGKIGLSPKRVMGVIGSYDPAAKALTVVKYSKPRRPGVYVNSLWDPKVEPYAGDVVNSYNDGPVKPGEKPMGPFYELETSSPAAALAPGQALTHSHYTIHFQGPEADLDAIAQKVLGVKLKEVNEAFKVAGK